MPTANATSDSALRGQAPLNLAVLTGLVLVAMARSLALWLSPLELGVDEAQYWLWSQTFDFGYFTKPPMTSWIIAVTHALFGHESWAVRIAAPWLHLATALLLWRSAAWLFGRAAGRWAGVIWMLLPAVSLGSFVISTDTPLLFFWTLALLLVVAIQTGRMRAAKGMILAGFAIGCGMLAKYAALYFALGMGLFWVWMAFKPGARTDGVRLSLTHLLLFLGAMLLAASPNLIWNLLHDFATVRHLGDNANLARQSYNLSGSLAFVAAQFLTAGPLSFALMLLILRSSRRSTADRMLLCLSMPPLAAMTVQAFLSEANANWALTAMPALTLWLAGWITRNRAVWGWAATGINAAIGGVLLLVVSAGSLGPLTPQSDPLRRLRGWQALSTDVATALQGAGAQTVIADRRATAASLNWYFYDRGVTILVNDADGVPSNHFEANHAWQPAAGRTVLLLDGRATPPQIDGIDWLGLVVKSDVAISKTRQRTLYIYAGIEQAR